MATPKWLDLRTAAAKLGHADSSALRHQIARGRIPKAALTKIGSSWAIDQAWLVNYPGRTRKDKRGQT